jgi:hypothetical protein
MSDYVSVVEVGRELSTKTGMSPHKATPFYSPTLQFEYSQAHIDALNINSNDEIYKVLNYFQRLATTGKNRPLVRYIKDLIKCTESFSMSAFGKNPYSENLGFAKKDRQDYITHFATKVAKEVGTQHKTLGRLVEFAGLRNTDKVVLNDAKLLSMIQPSQYNTQPHHQFIQYLALKEIPTIIAAEPLIWRMVDGKVFSGHLDLFQVEGKKIRVIDYKPDLNFDPDSLNVANHFVDSIPQIACYGVIFDLMFGLLGYEIECVTFNEDGFYIYDPYEALESSVQFYWDHINKLPDWAGLLPKATIDKIINS